MRSPSHSSPGRRRAWRVATPVVVLLIGGLFAVSAERSDGFDLRGGRLTDLASVVRAERDEAGELTARAAALNDEVEALSTELGDRSVARAQDEIATLVDPAGLTEKSGTAVQVTLDDAPEEARLAYDGDPNDLVVHQQDIQAVANAMWNAGAEAVTIQGQRLISTTGIKCEGNQVTLHGIPYSPPYVIVGIGDPASMEAELTTDPILAIYRDYTLVPGGGVSWDMARLDSAVAPAYDGLLDLTYATPMPE
ncbi:membrane protein [Planomonospora venezuelensis]|nr:membrane protein [Planomonospora venezuelensis]